MSEPKVLHICRAEKFIPPFIDLVQANFDPALHEFVIFGDHKKFSSEGRSSVHRVEKGFAGKTAAKVRLIVQMHRADRIILHGLFTRAVIKMLFFMPWLLKKTYWVIWGNDLYGKREAGSKPGLKDFSRRFVIRHLGHLVTYVPGDIELAREWYGAGGQVHSCLMYTSNLFSDPGVGERTTDFVEIQVGNSADPSNNHLEVFEKLASLSADNFRVLVPLSYGNQQHALRVISEGKKLFGDRFVPLIDFLPLAQYQEFLATIDIAIFNHKRQQGLGNLISLLGMGKKVYLRRGISTTSLLDSLEIEWFDVENIDLSPIPELSKEGNVRRVRQVFSKPNLIAQLDDLFKG
ncbi:TDP-N-acetylfucosamine:lipid II N-acetylfucosaminyltransferase [Marinobacter antarcticus]|uniref:TDP-N-acetylfucosamine:lipid II N-acetylfucosaminyltransferase n=1 Tax=Marinobacter antarcticus TaxID=564117 RepID=UPI0015876D09|nr:TDP-N-acetylfucosamine:lipid II N-acetylfucosaminyltransferase [Marinobacter antarcticus]